MTTALAESPCIESAAVTLREAGAVEWTVHGQPLRDIELRRRILDVLRTATELLHLDAELCNRDLRDFSSARDGLELVHDRLSRTIRDKSARRRGVTLATLVETLMDVQALRVEVSQARARQQARRFAEVGSALARLRSIRTVAQMIERAPAELCRCGFDRAFVSRVQDSVWHAESCHVDGDPEWAAEIVRVGRARAQRLDDADMPLEAEMVRRRGPLLVSDVQSHSRVQGLIADVSQSRSYVAAPVMPENRVIGFLHADGFMARRLVDEDDRAVLWMFAEGFGYALQRTILVERLFGLRNRVYGMTNSMGTVMDDVCGAETEMACINPEGAEGASMRAASMASIAPESRLEALLTRREIDVLRLMAMGKSNGDIAEHLVISPGTVKSHVARILRKMCAANRAEAVFRFTRLAGAMPSTSPPFTPGAA